jgi:hypothetical protein
MCCKSLGIHHVSINVPAFEIIKFLGGRARQHLYEAAQDFLDSGYILQDKDQLKAHCVFWPINESASSSKT